MVDLVDVLVEDERWAEFGLAALAQQVCSASLSFLKFVPGNYEISLLGCDDARIAVLNADFRGKSGATNVLSWPTQDLCAQNPGDVPAAPGITPGPAHELGDIAIAYETCLKEAEAAKTPFKRHVSHLLVHGTLHLLGYDHIVKEDAALMEDLECQVLATMGYPDPYEAH